MKALLLAAGLGTRLRPLTNEIPKCLVPIQGKPLLSYWIDTLVNAGITEILINTHYFSEKVEDFIHTHPHKKYITMVYEKELLNTGGTILANKEFFKHEPFILIHADNLSFCDFNAFLRSHTNRPKKTELTMMLFKTTVPKSCGIVQLDSNNIVEAFFEKVENPPSNLANGAVYICESSIITFLESLKKEEIDFSLEVIPAYLGKINTFLNDVYHKDIGSPQTYDEAQKDILKFIHK